MNKICLISGESKRNNLSIIKRLIRNNYKVYSFSKIGVTNYENDNFMDIKHDINNFEETQKIINNIISIENKIDVVIHNSDIRNNKINYNYRSDIMINNILSSYNLLNLPINSMRKNKSGDIILISSNNDLTDISRQTNYSSKNWLSGFCRSIALKNASFNIKVNTISQGYFYKDTVQKIDTKIIKNIPPSNFSKPQYIADTVESLLNSKYITGTNINVNEELN
jgi:3-oxoacyl-[acyl-carrier protein] reductase